MTSFLARRRGFRKIALAAVFEGQADVAQTPAEKPKLALSSFGRLLRSGRRHHRIFLRLEFRNRNGADGNDDVGRNIQPARRDPDGLLARCFIEAVGLALVRTEKGKKPLYSDLVIDLLDLLKSRVVEVHLLRKISLDQEQRHDRTPMK